MTRSRARWATLLGVLSLGAICSWIHYITPEIEGIDDLIYRHSTVWMRVPSWNDFMARVSRATNIVPLVIASAVFAIGITWSYSVRLTIWFLAVSLVSSQLVTFLKDLAGRQRPSGDFLLATNSWPSGHATGTMTLALTVLAIAWLAADERMMRFATWLLVPMAILVGLSRVGLRAHWGSDVVSGWMLSATLVMAMLSTQGPVRPSRSTRPVLLASTVAVAIIVGFALRGPSPLVLEISSQALP